MDENWADDYLLTRSVTNPGERAALYREAARGRWVVVVRGVYLRADRWSELTREGRHLARMRAHELLRPGTVFSHLSAAVAWGLPIVAAELSVPHAVAAISDGGRSLNGLIRHTVGVPDDLHRVGGLTVTSPRATVLHVAASARPETSIPILDVAFASPAWSLDRDGLLAEARELSDRSGPARAVWALEFADGRSGSAGESLSRVSIWRQRLPAPDLQCEFVDGAGLIGIVDFFWPDYRLVGEFDGVGKYVREEFRAGRTPAEVVLDEKRRENRLRALSLGVARWEWADALAPARLGTILRKAGLRAP